MNFNLFNAPRSATALLYARIPGEVVIGNLGDIPLQLLVYPKGLSAVVKARDADDARALPCCEPVPIASRPYAHSGTNALGFVELAARFCALSAAEKSLLVARTVEVAGQYCTVAFADYISARLHEKHIYAVRAPCGSGKTVFVVESLKTWKAAKNDFAALVVTPRAALCDKIASDLSAVAGVHHYKSGVYNEACNICVSTLDSLENVYFPFGYVRTRPDVVVIDELATVIAHLSSSPTLSKSPTKRDNCMRLLLTSCALARLLIVLDRDIGPLETMFLALVAAQHKSSLAEQNLLMTQRYHFTSMVLTGRQPPREIVMRDVASAVKLALDFVKDGKKVAIFAPNNNTCQAIKDLAEEELPGQNIVAIHGRAEERREFSQDANGYLRESGARLLVYNTAIGVGVSITEPFDVVIAVTPRYLTDRDVQQAVARVRGMRVIGVVEGVPRRELSSLRRNPTVRTILNDFELRLQHEAGFHRKFSPLLLRSAIDGRLSLDRSDMVAVFFVVAMYAREMELAWHSVIRDHRRYDDGVPVQHAALESSKEERQRLRAKEKFATALNSVMATVVPGDSATEIRQKIAVLPVYGITPAHDCVRDSAFMSAVADGRADLGNVWRVYMLYTYYELGGVEAVAKAEAWRIRTQTESAISRVFDDDYGAGAQSELSVVVECLGWLHLDASALLQARTTTVDAVLSEARDDLRKKLRRANSERYKSLKSREKDYEKTCMEAFNRYIGAAYFDLRSRSTSRAALALPLLLADRLAAKEQLPRVQEDTIAVLLSEDWPILTF